jgi:ribonucleotide reductase beta subunit family protein with ferritin-like domain
MAAASLLGSPSYLPPSGLTAPTSLCNRSPSGSGGPGKINVLCDRGTKRFVLYPIQYPEVWDLYKQAVRSMWAVEDGDLSMDTKHWAELSEDERHFLKHVLAFFAAADGILGENLAVNFYAEITLPEARAFYGFQLAMENIHAETYSLLLTTLVTDEEERVRLTNAIETIPAVRAKAEWAMRWMDPATASLPERLVAFTCVEGISFQGSFCAIFWLKKRGLMPGLALYNEFISRDEGLHMQFGALMYVLAADPLPVERVHAIVQQAVDCEVQFITEAFSAKLVGLNADTMTEFIRCTANVVCTYLKVPALYPDAVNPYEWMELIDTDGKTNFFERRVSEYSKPTATCVAAPEAYTGDADF